MDIGQSVAVTIPLLPYLARRKVTQLPSICSAVRRFLAQSLHLLEPLGDVAEDGRYSKHPTSSVRKRENGELDRNTRAALPQCRNRKNIPGTVACLSGPHRLRKAVPMTLLEIFRDDYVEGFSHGFRF